MSNTAAEVSANAKADAVDNNNNNTSSHSNNTNTNNNNAATPVDPEQVSQIAETFTFLSHEREDVRKMAMQGLAQLSKDSAALCYFLRTPPAGPAAAQELLQYLHVGAGAMLGDLLTLLINVCAADAVCAEVLIEKKIVRKAFRLLDGLERAAASALRTAAAANKSNNNDNDNDKDDSAAKTASDAVARHRTLQELTLMLINNLTASHVAAVGEVLQLEDEDMKGFYIGKLQNYYEALTPASETPEAMAAAAAAEKAAAAEREEKQHQKKEEAEGNSNTAAATAAATDAPSSSSAPPPRCSSSPSSPPSAASSSSSPSPPSAAAADPATDSRDVRRWILNILLNISRVPDGQELLLSDPDWRDTFCTCLAHPRRPRHRLLAAWVLRNCCRAPQPHLSLLLAHGAPALTLALRRLTDPSSASRESIGDVQMALGECLPCLLEAEEGMRFLEGLNAKQLLAAAVAAGREAHPRLDGKGSNDNNNNNTSSNGKQSDRVEVLEEDEDGSKNKSEQKDTNNAKNGAEETHPRAGLPAVFETDRALLEGDVCTLIEDHILPYLDDIIDAYLPDGVDLNEDLD